MNQAARATLAFYSTFRGGRLVVPNVVRLTPSGAKRARPTSSRPCARSRGVFDGAGGSATARSGGTSRHAPAAASNDNADGGVRPATSFGVNFCPLAPRATATSTCRTDIFGGVVDFGTEGWPRNTMGPR